MLIVEGTIDVDPADREAFLEGRRAAVTATRSEPGCIEYAFSADLIDPGRVRVFERWASAEDLDAHLGQLGQRPATPGAVAPTTAEFRRYEIASVSDLGV
jgi:quinol monooxygenase YgiN